MQRSYAGILGLLAFATCVARGLMHGGGVEATMKLALAAMVILAVVGYLAGWIADSLVEQSVRLAAEEQLAELQKAEKAAAKETTRPTNER